MSTFLQLVQRTGTECGISGTITNVATATGEWARVVNWVNSAYEDIQLDNPEWEWMRKNVTFNTVAQKNTYSPTTDLLLTDFASWKDSSFRIYNQAQGVGTESLLGFRDYDSFRDFYLLSSTKTVYSDPTEITIAPNKDLMLGMSPDTVYVVSGEYYKLPVTLSANADVPDMPARFHLAIVYKAMMSYGGYESAPEVYQRGEAQYKSFMNKIRYDQMPAITRGSSLI